MTALQELEELIKDMTPEQLITLREIIRQDKRAHALGLSVDCDQNPGFLFIADATTNTVIAPPPMNLETVAAWLDDYEKEEAEE